MGLRVWLNGVWYKPKEFERFLEKLSEEEKQKLGEKKSYFDGKVWILGDSWFEVYKTLFEGKGISEETIKWLSEEVYYSDLLHRNLTNFEVITCKISNKGFVAKKISEKEEEIERIEKIDIKYVLEEIKPYLIDLKKVIPNLTIKIPAQKRW